jgi:hypothetical protein
MKPIRLKMFLNEMYSLDYAIKVHENQGGLKLNEDT